MLDLLNQLLRLLYLRRRALAVGREVAQRGLGVQQRVAKAASASQGQGDVGAGFGDEALIRSSVASRAKHVGGDAAVQITNNTTFSGIMHFAPNIYTATSTRTMSFAIIKYVD